jgi:hypothetical protein
MAAAALDSPHMVVGSVVQQPEANAKLLEPRTKDRRGSCQYLSRPRRAVGTLLGQLDTDGGVPRWVSTSLQAQLIAITRLKLFLLAMEVGLPSSGNGSMSVGSKSVSALEQDHLSCLGL